MTHNTRIVEIVLPAKASVPSGNQSKETVLESSFSSDISKNKFRRENGSEIMHNKGWVGMGIEREGEDHQTFVLLVFCKKQFTEYFFSQMSFQDTSLS
jgi:hypothetical protein